MADWAITRTTGRCAASGRELAPGEAYYSVLFDRGDTFERLDYAEECWQGPPADAFCTWRARMPVPQERQRRFLDNEVLMDFFERLAGQSEESKVQFRFVLTLILMRKRLLKYLREVEEDGAKWWIVRLMGPFRPDDESKATRRVLNPELDEGQIEEVSGQLGVILTGDFSTWDQPIEADASAAQGDTPAPAEGASGPAGGAAAPQNHGEPDG